MEKTLPPALDTRWIAIESVYSAYAPIFPRDIVTK